MKRREFVRRLVKDGCIFLRAGANHDLYMNPATEKKQPVPRHKEIDSLPLKDYETFVSDKRNIWSAESCVRRTLEALMDLGRHIMAKGFGHGVSEYKQIGPVLAEIDILNDLECATFKTLAGYRNRMVHFYHEIFDKELFEICSSQLSDIAYVAETIKKWVNNHPELRDETL